MNLQKQSFESHVKNYRQADDANDKEGLLSPAEAIDDDESNHNCHKHWAFALYKKGEMAKAIKMIKKGVLLDPNDGDNWVIWGLIMRTVGSYKSALHKFEQALKLDRDNQTAKYEMELLQRIMVLDSQVTLEQVAGLKRLRPNFNRDGTFNYGPGGLDLTHELDKDQKKGDMYSNVCE